MNKFSKNKQKVRLNFFLFSKVRDNIIFEANQDLERKIINAGEFLDRMTSRYTDICKGLIDCQVANLDYFEIDEMTPVQQGNNIEQFNCQLCEDKIANVVLSCSCQLICDCCLKTYANTVTINSVNHRRPYQDNGYPIINTEFPMKCPHCTKQVEHYIVSRTR